MNIDFAAARRKMVDNQIRTTDVTSHKVLKAFLSVAREDFVQTRLKPLAYIDDDLEIMPAEGGSPARYLMEASPLAKLLQLADISKDDVVLEIGCGSGYVAALLSLLAGSVVAVESQAALIEDATENLSKGGYDNVAVVSGDLELGYPAEGPYDAIFVNGAVDQVPDAIVDQLRDGGRLVAIIGTGHSARAHVFTRENGRVSRRADFNASIKPLPGFETSKEFVF